MFYYVIFYSFDSDRQCIGPFSTEEEAWAAMEEDADRESFLVDQYAVGRYSEIVKDRQSGEITMVEYANGYARKTTWFIIEIKQ